jgi:hypothetical protein
MQNPVIRSLERTPIRIRDSEVTRAAWRMDVDSDSGSGSITLIDIPDSNPIYRGDGLFLGCPQDQLADLYTFLLAPPDEAPFETLQLG